MKFQIVLLVVSYYQTLENPDRRNGIQYFVMILFFFCCRKDRKDHLNYFSVSFIICQNVAHQSSFLSVKNFKFCFCRGLPLTLIPPISDLWTSFCFQKKVVRTNTSTVGKNLFILLLSSIHFASSLICSCRVTYTEKAINKFFPAMPCCLPERLQLIQILAVGTDGSILFPGISFII